MQRKEEREETKQALEALEALEALVEEAGVGAEEEATGREDEA
jgi:hypothetical protein